MDVADHAIALALTFLRGIAMYNAAVFEDPSRGWVFGAVPTIRRLSTQTFGVVGLGRIGTATALRAKALGMHVVFHDPIPPDGHGARARDRAGGDAGGPPPRRRRRLAPHAADAANPPPDLARTLFAR